MNRNCHGKLYLLKITKLYLYLVLDITELYKQKSAKSDTAVIF